MAHHAELTQKIEGYKKNAQPQELNGKKGEIWSVILDQGVCRANSVGPIVRGQVLPPLDSDSDEHWLLMPMDGKAARDAASDAEDDHLVSRTKKRAANVEAKGAADKAKRVCMDKPSQRE